MNTENPTRKKNTGEPGNGGQFAAQTHAEAETALLAIADDKSLDDSVWRYSTTYADRVHLARDPETSTRMLRAILEREEEDDFMFAIARHPNAEADMIELASQHHSPNVRRAAIDNPNTALSTLVRIENDALAAELNARDRFKAEGVSPSREHIGWEATTASALAAYARSRIAERTAR